jgi:hypothetical protein
MSIRGSPLGPRNQDPEGQNWWWGGWGSNPRPADYEKYGPTLRALCLHRYHEVVPLIAPIALVAPAARSTNRSTAAAPDPFALLLPVTSPVARGVHPREWARLVSGPRRPLCVCALRVKGPRNPPDVITAGNQRRLWLLFSVVDAGGICGLSAESRDEDPKGRECVYLKRA